MSLCPTEAHGDAVLPGPVAASGHTADVVLLDVGAGQKPKQVSKQAISLLKGDKVCFFNDDSHFPNGYLHHTWYPSY